MLIANILERFDVVALQELQGYTNALQQVLRCLIETSRRGSRVVVTDVVKGDDGDSERLG